MVRSYRIVTGLLVVCAAAAARAQQRDILDAATARPLGTTVNGVAVRFGDPDLDAAELALHDALPRPWTVGGIRPLFQAAVARFTESRQGSGSGDAGAYSEWEALVLHLGSVLAASRDPRAALALGPVIESNGFPSTCFLASGFLRGFGTDTGYRAAPFLGPAASTNGCPYFVDQAKRWFELNRGELEKRAAAIDATSPPCTSCEHEVLASIDQLRARLSATGPRLRLTVEGGGTPRFLQFEGIIRPTSAPSGGTRSMQRLSGTSSDVPIRIPGTLLGRTDVGMVALIISPGYQTAVIDVPSTAKQPVIPVTLVPLPSKTLRGSVTFRNGATPRPFVIGVDLRVSCANDSSGIFSGSMSTLQGIAEAAVDTSGRFSLVIPDIALDHVLGVPGNRFVLRAQSAAFVLEPDEIDLGSATDVELNLSASPRPRVQAPRPNPTPPRPCK